MHANEEMKLAATPINLKNNEDNNKDNDARENTTWMSKKLYLKKNNRVAFKANLEIVHSVENWKNFNGQDGKKNSKCCLIQ